MREFQTREIDGRAYRINPMTPTEALTTLGELISVVGEPVASFVGSVDRGNGVKSILDAKLNPEALKNAVGALAKQLASGTPKAVSMVTRLSTRGINCDGKEIVFDHHFHGTGLAHLFKVVFAVLEVNYGDFFSSDGEKAGSAPSMTGPDTTPGR